MRRRRHSPPANAPRRAVARLLAALALAPALVAPACGSRGSSTAPEPARDEPVPPRSASSPATATTQPNEVDLIPMLSQGSIDAAGPVVDLGERQADAYLLPPLPLGADTINGDSWARVGSRIRLRVPVSTTEPPDSIQLRVRRPQARGVLAVVDGVPVRNVPLPTNGAPAVVTLPVAPDRFRRDVADVELRFFGVNRAAASGTGTGRIVVVPPAGATAPAPARTRGPRGRRAARLARAQAAAAAANAGPTLQGMTRPRAPAPRPVAEVDWVHLVRGTVPAVRAADLVADVRTSSGPPRRALTLYAPALLSTVTVIPPRTEFRAALSAQGVRGGSRAPAAVPARITVEVDGQAAAEVRRQVEPGAAWDEVSLDLSAFAGKAARITVAAPEGGETRLAVADPRLVARTEAPAEPPQGVRHVLMLVVRGARADRFFPNLSSRLSFGGFARLLRDGLSARAVAPSPLNVPALASALTGLPADAHGMIELTDTLDENAPTLGTRLRAAGIATAAFSDDAWWVGSGLDRGFAETHGCADQKALCKGEPVISDAVEWLARQREHRAVALVITRAGTPPFDPPADLLAAMDPAPAENAIMPDQTANFAARARRHHLTLDPHEAERLEVLYDASLAGVDRALNAALDRLRDAGMLADTAVLVVGDHGTALGEVRALGEGPELVTGEHGAVLGESRLFGEGPMSCAAVSHTVMLLAAPGVPAGRVAQTLAVLDASQTVLDALGAAPAAGGPGERAGATSVLSARGGGFHPRGVIVSAGLRDDDLGLRFGELFALGRAAGGFALFDPDQDPLGQIDLAAQRPIARAFAETVLGAYRAPGRDDAPRPTYVPSTRPLPPAVETVLRGQGLLGPH